MARVGPYHDHKGPCALCGEPYVDVAWQYYLGPEPSAGYHYVYACSTCLRYRKGLIRAVCTWIYDGTAPSPQLIARMARCKMSRRTT